MSHGAIFFVFLLTHLCTFLKILLIKKRCPLHMLGFTFICVYMYICIYVFSMLSLDCQVVVEV